MQMPIGQFAGGGDPLACPKCGSEYLHQEDVQIWNRAEDGEKCFYAKIENVRALIDEQRGNSGNPSPRRQGMCINFLCEGCGIETVHALLVFQHKGMTFIEWASR